MERRGSLLARATCAAVRCAQRVPHILVEEVLEGTRETAATRGVECAGDLTYIEYLVKILDTLERITRSKRIRMCKVQWSNHAEDKATWEREDELQADFP
jgi:hypothetical protein